MPPAPRPTNAELAILTVLWRRGPATVRQVLEDLGKKRTQKTGYTTVLKLMQIMTDKGLLKRDESERSHVYRPAAPQRRMQKTLVGDLIDRAFAGSMSQLVLSALATRQAEPDELAEIRRLLRAEEQRARGEE